MKEKIFKILQDSPGALAYEEIFSKLSGAFSIEELSGLKDLLEGMQNEGEVYYTTSKKYTLFEKCVNIYKGVLDVNKKGHGFVCKTGLDYDIHISPEKIAESGAIYNDIVVCEVSKEFLNDKSHKSYEGNRILRVLKRDLSKQVGTISFVNGRMEFTPDNTKYNVKLIINPETASQCVDGTKVVVKVNEQIGKKEDNIYTADVVKVLGHKDDPDVDIESVCASFGIFNQFSSKVMEQVSKIPDHVLDTDKVGRTDFTKRIVISIDGKDTKDRDDAISIERDGENYILGVHIADVSNYVPAGSPLDEAAYEKGTSTYPAGKVYPMLPHELSNGICSLNENVERLTLSVEICVDKNGRITDGDMYLGVINNNKVMNYDDVNLILEQGKVPVGYEGYVDTLNVMEELSEICNKASAKRGYLDFAIPEAKIIQDEKGVAVDVVETHQGKAEKLIENFMLLANQFVAQYISNLDLPFIYRVHDEPKEEKIEMFLDFCDKMGYKFRFRSQNLDSRSIKKILDEFKGKPQYYIISSYLLRSMSKAVYSESNIGHFGLALKDYTHFTSPIRRYPDLMVHRLLKTYIFNKDMSRGTVDYYQRSLPGIALQCSNNEQNSQEAERQVTTMKSAEYMEQHINEVHEGFVISVVNSGFFVRFNDKPIEGFVSVASLKDDHYTYVQDSYALIGNRVGKDGNRRIYRPGVKVSVIVVAASKETGMIDCEIFDSKKKVREEDKEGNDGNYKQRIKF